MPEERWDFKEFCLWNCITSEENIMDKQSKSQIRQFLVHGRGRVFNYAMSGKERPVFESKPRSSGIVAIEEFDVAGMARDWFFQGV